MSFISIIITPFVEALHSALTLPYAWLMHNADLTTLLQSTMSRAEQVQLDDNQISSENALTTLQINEQENASVLGDSTQPNPSEVANNLMLNESPVTFMSLPDLVKRRIFEYLLDEEEVVECAMDNDDALVKHTFHTAIMRTNKDTYDLAKDVFHGNHFILVSISPSGLLDWFVKRKLSFWKDNSKHFNGFHLRAHINCHTHETAQPKKNAFLMVTLRFLPHLTQILREQELAENESFKLTLEVKRANSGAMLSTKTQGLLLEPFRRLYLDKCTVYGEVDQDLADSVTSATTSTIKWIRATAWSCYDTAVFLKNLADVAYLCDNYPVAIECYESASEFVRLVCSYQNYIDIPDVNYHRNFNMLNFAIGLSWAQVLVHTLVSEPEKDKSLVPIALRIKRLRILRGIEHLQHTTTGLFDNQEPSKIQFDLMVGIAQIALGDRDEEGVDSMTLAAEEMEEAKPTNDTSIFDLFSCAQEMGEAWLDKDKEEKTDDAREEFLRALDELVPHWPYASEYVEGCACKYKSEYQAQEVYILKALGYKRDPHEARIDANYFETLEDPVDGAVTPFDREEADVQIQQRKKVIEEAARRRGGRMRYTMECIVDPDMAESGGHEHFDRAGSEDGSDEESGSEGSEEGTEGDTEWEDEEE